MPTDPRSARHDGLDEVIEHPRESDEQAKKRLWGQSNHDGKVEGGPANYEHERGMGEGER
jgi:hypothetical protein